MKMTYLWYWIQWFWCINFENKQTFNKQTNFGDNPKNYFNKRTSTLITWGQKSKCFKSNFNKGKLLLQLYVHGSTNVTCIKYHAEKWQCNVIDLYWGN